MDEPNTIIEGAAPAADPVVAPVVAQAEVPATPAAPADPKGTDTPTEITAPTEDIKLSGLKFDGQDVTVDIPVDLACACTEKGIDIKAVAQELYSEAGISPENKQALYTAFGKWQVDAYLKGLDSINRETITRFKTDSETSIKAQEQAWTDTIGIMGGQDRWADLDAYAVQNLTDADMEEFNSVMQSGSLKMQTLMIRDLWSKFEEAGKPNAPASLDLERGENIPATDASGAITQAEYLNSFKTGEYRKDPGTWDARRKAGYSKGI